MDYIKIAIITLAAVQGVLLMVPPIVIKTKDQQYLNGATARNNSIFIWIDPDQTHYRAVLAQEYYECETRKWLYNLVKWHVSKSYKQELEATGQEIEVQKVAELNWGVNETLYRRHQAATLTKKYKQFEGWSIDDVEALMIRQRDVAQRWLRDSDEV